jgi:hypothetical protein
MFDDLLVYAPSPESLPPTFLSYSAFVTAYSLFTNADQWEQVNLPADEGRKKMTVADWNKVFLLWEMVGREGRG